MAVTTHFYNNFFKHLGSGQINLVSNTIKAILVNAYTFDSTDEFKADLGSVELPTGVGYTSGGKELTNKTLNYSVDKTQWDADDLTWSISGGTLGPFTGAILYDDTSTGDKLICYIDLGDSVTASAGTDLKLVFATNGILSIS